MVSSPADLRYQEDLLFPNRIIEDAERVKVGRPLREAVKTPSRLRDLKEKYATEKFLLNQDSDCTYMILEYGATGEDALRGWMLAAYAAEIEKTKNLSNDHALEAAYGKVDDLFPSFLSDLQKKGWHTDRFLDGTGSRYAL